MGTLTLNNTFEIEYPDDFHVLTGEERSRMNFAKEGEGECLEAKDRHIIISIAWQKLGGFTDLMRNSRDFAKNVRGSIRKLMRSQGYTDGQKLSRKIAGLRADGFTYTYSVKDKGMYGETYTFKNDKYVYYLYYYSRQELADDNAAVWQQMIDSIRIR